MLRRTKDQIADRLYDRILPTVLSVLCAAIFALAVVVGMLAFKAAR